MLGVFTHVASWQHGLKALKQREIKVVDMGNATGRRDLDSLQPLVRKVAQ